MKPQVKRFLALVCVLATAALLLLPVLPKVFAGAPKHYRSVHPVSPVASLMGFGPDSVFNAGSAADIFSESSIDGIMPSFFLPHPISQQKKEATLLP